jgi:hypothetical protein
MYGLSQPFAKDSNWYTLAPGQSVGSFNGDGWTLIGGARLVTTDLADGSTGTVLDLPAGSKAVSPPMCVSAAYPTAKTLIRDVEGPPSVRLYTAYTNTPCWLTPAYLGGIPGSTKWAASPPLKLKPGNLFGWQEEVFTLTGGAKGTDAQVYNFWVDPHCFR